ncbi:HAD family hydrolase [Limosilactobacillus caecicola]|uniref:HAD family hydrolase n=1 Tax=Limosilactobacillus caecicola TaxID=2941332 RepID=UPI00203CE46B|nr:HAD family hydrolase [Limosilactobacillus caecicola]
MAQLHNFIFDIDGTLINTIDMYMPAMFETLKKHGYTYTPEEIDHLNKVGFGITADDALRLGNVKEADIRPIQTEWFQLAYTRQDQVTVFPGIKEMLDDLSRRPETELAVATSKLNYEYQNFRKRYYFADLFNVAITAEDTTKHKPDPDPILAAVKAMNADPASTVYVGDTVNDLQAAHAAGVKFAAALYGSANPEAIQEGADILLHTPTDLEHY